MVHVVKHLCRGVFIKILRMRYSSRWTGPKYTPKVDNSADRCVDITDLVVPAAVLMMQYFPGISSEMRTYLAGFRSALKCETFCKIPDLFLKLQDRYETDLLFVPRTFLMQSARKLSI